MSFGIEGVWEKGMVEAEAEHVLGEARGRCGGRRMREGHCLCGGEGDGVGEERSPFAIICHHLLHFHKQLFLERWRLSSKNGFYFGFTSIGGRPTCAQSNYAVLHTRGQRSMKTTHLSNEINQSQTHQHGRQCAGATGVIGSIPKVSNWTTIRTQKRSLTELFSTRMTAHSSTALPDEIVTTADTVAGPRIA